MVAGIIEKSNSPWMASAVFAPKKLRLCIDYTDKRTILF